MYESGCRGSATGIKHTPEPLNPFEFRSADYILDGGSGDDSGGGLIRLGFICILRQRSLVKRT